MNKKKVFLIIINILLIFYLLCIIVFINNDKVIKDKEIIKVSKNLTKKIFIEKILNNISGLCINDIYEHNIMFSSNFNKEFNNIKNLKRNLIKSFININIENFEYQKRKIKNNLEIYGVFSFGANVTKSIFLYDKLFIFLIKYKYNNVKYLYIDLKYIKKNYIIYFNNNSFDIESYKDKSFKNFIKGKIYERKVK